MKTKEQQQKELWEDLTEARNFIITMGRPSFAIQTARKTIVGHITEIDSDKELMEAYPGLLNAYETVAVALQEVEKVVKGLEENEDLFEDEFSGIEGENSDSKVQE